MTELCINTYEKHQIGEITSGETWNENDEWVPIALQILEEITVEEYLSFVESKNLSHKIKRSIYNPELFFYRCVVLD